MADVEKKKPEESLRFTQAEMKALSQGFQDIYFKVDGDGCILDCQAGDETLIYVLPKEFLGKRMQEVLPSSAGQLFTEAIQQVKKTGQKASLHYWLPIAGNNRHFEARLVPFQDNQIVIIARDITEQTLTEESLLESSLKLQRALEGIAKALALVLEKRDPYTAGHEKRVAKLACAIAEVMGLSKDIIAGIRITAFLHDIGKIVVPAEILSKPSRLNEFEYSIVKTHPEVGYDILKELEFPWPVAQVILQHHERLNGTGYPKGLTGESIILEARIMAVADVIESMCSHRPYRPALGIQKALAELNQNKGTLYDPMVVEACIKVFNEHNFKFE